MTIAELISQLVSLNAPDALVVQSRDSEGNSFAKTTDIALYYWEEHNNNFDNRIGLIELTPSAIAAGYTTADLVDPTSQKCVCFWP